MSYGGELERELPAYINLLPSFEYKKFTSQNLLKIFLSVRNVQDLGFLKARLKHSFILRKGNFGHMPKAQFFWETIGKVMPRSKKEYDVAIGFAQGFPTFYVADKIQAKKKICWINSITDLKIK